MIRRILYAFAAIGIVCSFAMVGVQAVPDSGIPVIKAYKAQNRSCCGRWVKHLQATGFFS